MIVQAYLFCAEEDVVGVVSMATKGSPPPLSFGETVRRIHVEINTFLDNQVNASKIRESVEIVNGEILIPDCNICVLEDVTQD